MINAYYLIAYLFSLGLKVNMVGGWEKGNLGPVEVEEGKDGAEEV